MHICYIDVVFVYVWFVHEDVDVNVDTQDYEETKSKQWPPKYASYV